VRHTRATPGKTKQDAGRKSYPKDGCGGLGGTDCDVGRDPQREIQGVQGTDSVREKAGRGSAATVGVARKATGKLKDGEGKGPKVTVRTTRCGEVGYTGRELTRYVIREWVPRKDGS